MYEFYLCSKYLQLNQNLTNQTLFADAEGVFPEAKRTPTPTRYAATTSEMRKADKPGSKPTVSIANLRTMFLLL